MLESRFSADHPGDLRQLFFAILLNLRI